MSIIKRKSIAESRNQDSKNLEHLSLTRNLMSSNGHPHKIWEWLDEQYNSINEGDSISRGMVSVINSILNQERVYFAISRNGLQELVKNDMNFKTKKGEGFKHNKYSKILSKLQEDGYISKFIDSKGTRAANGYEVVDAEILGYLDRKIDKEAQKLQVTNFINKLSKGTDLGTKDGKMVRSKDDKNIRPEDHKVVRSQDASRILYNHDKTLTQVSSTTTFINPEHLELLNNALAASPNHPFLKDKHESLSKYGSFTSRQLTVIKSIAKQPITPKPKGGIDVVEKCIKMSPEDAIKELDKYTWNKTEAAFNNWKSIFIKYRIDKDFRLKIINIINPEWTERYKSLLN